MHQMIRIGWRIRRSLLIGYLRAKRLLKRLFPQSPKQWWHEKGPYFIEDVIIGFLLALGSVALFAVIIGSIIQPKCVAPWVAMLVGGAALFWERLTAEGLERTICNSCLLFTCFWTYSYGALTGNVSSGVTMGVSIGISIVRLIRRPDSS